MSKLLVIGRSGQLARELTRARRPEGWALTAIGRERLAAPEHRALADLIDEARPSLVINAAAYTAVDKAESEKEAAYALNRDLPGALAAVCADADIPLIHVSTDYVFDGRKAGAYLEDDPVNPVSIYGASKEAGERAVRERLSRHVIIRTSWLYSAFGTNFVTSMLRLGQERDELAIVADQEGSPTHAGDLARAILAIAQAVVSGKTDGYGTFHYCNRGRISRYDFAAEIFRRAAAFGIASPKLRAIATPDYPTPAVRPPNSTLDCARIGAIYAILPPAWQDSLQHCLRELLAPPAQN